MFNQPDYNKEKPDFLYRGVKIKYELLKSFNLDGVDLKPLHPPVIDDKARKTVGDGNEYGVYMTDHDIVARNAYAAVKENDGTAVNRDVVFGYYKNMVKIPAVGIVYKINTHGLDVHIPWITSHLKGHYNNGMGGEEWITESVPASNYIVDTVEIGPDILHESEMIEFVDSETTKKELLNKINQRKERLELFEEKIESMPEKERYLLSPSEIEILKLIYKINGIMDIDLDNFEPKTPSEYIDYLKAIIYAKDKQNLDFQTLGYLQTLYEKAMEMNTVDDLVALINKDISKNEEQKNKFVERKEGNNEEYTTRSFDKKDDMYRGLLEKLDSKVNSKEKKKTYMDYLNECTKRLSELQSQYGIIAQQIEKLMIENSNNPIENYQQKLNNLIKQRDNISTKMKTIIQSQRTFQRAIDYEKEQEHRAVISQVEKIFSIRIEGITNTGTFIQTPNGMFPQINLKDKSTLGLEQENLLKQLEDLYYEGELDIKTWQSMKYEIGKEYEELISKAPPSSKKEKKFNESEVGKATINTTTAEKDNASEKVEMDIQEYEQTKSLADLEDLL